MSPLNTFGDETCGKIKTISLTCVHLARFVRRTLTVFIQPSDLSSCTICSVLCSRGLWCEFKYLQGREGEQLNHLRGNLESRIHHPVLRHTA